MSAPKVKNPPSAMSRRQFAIRDARNLSPRLKAIAWALNLRTGFHDETGRVQELVATIAADAGYELIGKDGHVKAFRQVREGLRELCEMNYLHLVKTGFGTTAATYLLTAPPVQMAAEEKRERLDPETRARVVEAALVQRGLRKSAIQTGEGLRKSAIQQEPPTPPKRQESATLVCGKPHVGLRDSANISDLPPVLTEEIKATRASARDSHTPDSNRDPGRKSRGSIRAFPHGATRSTTCPHAACGGGPCVHEKRSGLRSEPYAS